MKNKCVAFGVTGSYCWWDHQCDWTPEVLQPKCGDDTSLAWTARDWDGEIVWTVVASTDGGIEVVGVKL